MKTPDLVTRGRFLLDTPFGTMGAAFDDRDRLAALAFDPDAPVADGPSARDPAGETLADQLAAYFAGERTDFELPLAPAGTDFQQSVWRALLEIPYGETRSYGALADAVGRPDAVRAVGAAVGANPIAIVVPCHRVIGADGSLTGYGGGLERKRRLLALEAGQRPLL